MKKLFLALMAVAAIAIVGCERRHQVNDPEPPENDRNHNVLLTDTNGANQANRVPTRIPLSVTNTENGEE